MIKSVLPFLEQLNENNNREWFQVHKKEYEAAKTEVLEFVNSVIPVIGNFDDSVKYVDAKDCLFRIYRDVRFSKNKDPYKTNMGAWITPAGRKGPGPGYYMHLQPGESFLAAGVYMPEPDQLKRIRQEIYYNVEEFKSILENPVVKKKKVRLSDMEKNKVAPRDFPKDFPDIDLLKYRHYTFSCDLADSMIVSPGFPEHVVEIFKVMSPLNAFLRRALSE